MDLLDGLVIIVEDDHADAMSVKTKLNYKYTCFQKFSNALHLKIVHICWN